MGQLYSATPVFNVCFSVLLKRLFIQYRAFVMDSISFSVASRIERGLPMFLAVNAVREREKSLHVSPSRFTVTCHKFAFHVYVAFMSRSRRYGIHTIENRSFDFSRSRFTFTYRWNTGHSRFSTYFWLMGFSYDHISVVNDNNAMPIIQSSCLPFNDFRTGIEYNTVLYTLTFRNYLQFDNSVPLMIFLDIIG